MTSNEDGRKLKTNFTIPSEVKRIIFGANSFDEDATTFDSTSVKFDVAQRINSKRELWQNKQCGYQVQTT